MKEEIIEHLRLLEKEENINILYAAESGSRAWGCPSPDSDYDIRIIYKRSESEYLEIDDKPDSLDYFHGELLDINGWDIKKVLKLVRKSNVTPFEWSQSPIKYIENKPFINDLLGLCNTYFQPAHSINHYLGLAKNSYYKSKFGNSINLKKLFYVLRPLMAAKWIIDRNEIPPMDIPNLIDVISNTDIVKRINELLALKRDLNESHTQVIEAPLIDFIDNTFNYVEERRGAKSKKILTAEELNRFFKRTIKN